MRTDVMRPEALQSVFDDMEAAARRDMHDDGFAGMRRFVRETDMRYRGQEHTVHVRAPEGPVTPDWMRGLENRFHVAHRRKYTFDLDSAIEIVNVRLVATTTLQKPKRSRPKTQAVPSRPHGTRSVWLEDHGVIATPVFRRDTMSPGFSLSGPALIEEAASVTVLYPHMVLSVHETGAMIIETNA
jgi:N-methylhydantoinase A